MRLDGKRIGTTRRKLFFYDFGDFLLKELVDGFLLFDFVGIPDLFGAEIFLERLVIFGGGFRRGCADVFFPLN